MDTTTSTCTAHNGSYACSLTAGHAVQHENRTAIRDRDGKRIATRIARFADGYSAVRIFRTAR